jgi:hypothetical protein
MVMPLRGVLMPCEHFLNSSTPVLHQHDPLIKMKTEKLHSVGTVPKSNWKIVERGNYFVLLLEDGTLISIIILPVIFFIQML